MICLDELHDNIGTITPCGHCFHRECYNALKRNNESSRNVDSDDSSSSKLPRCPACKHKSKRFVDIYLTFEERSHRCISGAGGCSSASGSSCSYDDATRALASLTSENMRLRKSLQEVKSISKGQDEILLDVLPRFDELQNALAKMKKDKEEMEKELREIEEENSELLTGWNDIEMKMQMVKIEKEELEERLRETKRKNDDLNQKWNELDVKFNKAKKKRKLMESKQADELKDVKFQITKSKLEKDELFTMLKKAQIKTTGLKRIIKKLKRKQSKVQQKRNCRMKILG